MIYKCILKRGKVYIPTIVNQGTARYMDVEPVTVVSVADTEVLRRALRETIPKENRFVAPSVEDARRKPVLLKYTGDKSWSALMRGALRWVIKERDGKYQIVGSRVHPEGGWVDDNDQKIDFPAATPIGDVIDRMIKILQDAARQP
jgi:hypothetical protein